MEMDGGRGTSVEPVTTRYWRRTERTTQTDTSDLQEVQRNEETRRGDLMLCFDLSIRTTTSEAN